jgi:hypothetical protein
MMMLGKNASMEYDFLYRSRTSSSMLNYTVFVLILFLCNVLLYGAYAVLFIAYIRIYKSSTPLLPSFQIVRRFSFSRHIAFAIYLDIHYV